MVRASLERWVNVYERRMPLKAVEHHEPGAGSHIETRPAVAIERQDAVADCAVNDEADAVEQPQRCVLEHAAARDLQRSATNHNLSPTHAAILVMVVTTAIPACSASAITGSYWRVVLAPNR
jgi:hypothetical protein